MAFCIPVSPGLGALLKVAMVTVPCIVEYRAAMEPSGDQYEPVYPAFFSAVHIGMHWAVSWQAMAWGC